MDKVALVIQAVEEMSFDEKMQLMLMINVKVMKDMATATPEERKRMLEVTDRFLDTSTQSLNLARILPH